MPTRSSLARGAQFFMLFAIAALAPTWSLAGDKQLQSAPFGLSWGMSKADVQSLGVELTDAPSTKWGEMLLASGLPKMVADVEYVSLFFGYNDQLWRIAAISEPFHNDPYGMGVRQRYDQLVKVLEDKYGPGASEHHVDENYDGKDWVFGIAHGENWHQTTFDQGGVTAVIRVSASGFSDSNYILDFQHDDLAREVEQGRSQSERNAL